MRGEEYDRWVLNEYEMWSKALSEADMDTFRQHPVVHRMVSTGIDHKPFADALVERKCSIPWDQIIRIGSMGSLTSFADETVYRSLLYAIQLLDSLDSDELSVCEIGGGFGEFCAVLHAMAKHRGVKIGRYVMLDLKPVQEFQARFLGEVGVTGIEFPYDNFNADLSGVTHLVSLYSLAELDSTTKERYLAEVLPRVEHGLILWNPHFEEDTSGPDAIRTSKPDASVEPEFPMTGRFNLRISY